MNGISIVICCYNSATRINPTLLHLAHQKTDPKLAWEIILVDNNSVDDTRGIASAYWAELDTPITLTIVEEERIGLAYAREKGILSSSYNYILFCDDDNWLRKDYVQQIYNSINNDVTIGAIGGWGEAVFERTPHTEYKYVERYYAVGKPSPKSGKIDITKSYIYGAGMGVRKSSYLQLLNLNFDFILTGPKGGRNLGGDDLELMLAIALLGDAIVFDEQLTFKHFIPSTRLNRAYQEQRMRNGITFLVLRAYKDVYNSQHTPIKSYLRICLGYGWLWLKSLYGYLKDRHYNNYVLILEYGSVFKASVLFFPYYFKAKQQGIRLLSHRKK